MAKKKVAKKKAVKKVAKKKAVKKKVVVKPETDETKPDLPSPPAKSPIAVPVPVVVKAHCPCCRALVPKTLLRTCAKCSFQGCVMCRPTGTCPTCGYNL